MKKNFTRILGLVLALCLVFSCSAVNAFAAENSSRNGADTPSTFAYHGPYNFTVNGGTNTGSTRYHDGDYMAFEISATSNTASYVEVEVHVVGYKTYTYTVPCNGQTIKYDWIYMGSVGNHGVYFVEKCGSNTITFNLVSYSWYS